MVISRAGDKQNQDGEDIVFTSGGIGSVVDGWRASAVTYHDRDIRRSRRRYTRALRRRKMTSAEASVDACRGATAGSPAALRSPFRTQLSASAAQGVGESWLILPIRHKLLVLAGCIAYAVRCQIFVMEDFLSQQRCALFLA